MLTDSVRRVQLIVINAPHPSTVQNVAVDIIFTSLNQRNVQDNVPRAIMEMGVCANCANPPVVNVHQLINVSAASETIVSKMAPASHVVILPMMDWSVAIVQQMVPNVSQCRIKHKMTVNHNHLIEPQ